MQCNVEFGHQLSICSWTKENHGKPWSSSHNTGPSRCKLTSSQQSSIKYPSPNISPYLFCFFSFKTFISVSNLDKHQTVYNTCGGNECIFAQICLQIYIYLYPRFFVGNFWNPLYFVGIRYYNQSTSKVRTLLITPNAPDPPPPGTSHIYAHFLSLSLLHFKSHVHLISLTNPPSWVWMVTNQIA
jgi:hypothetical protein